MIWSFFTGRWGAIGTEINNHNIQAEKFSADPSDRPIHEGDKLPRQYSCSSPDFGRRLRAAAEEWKAKERAIQPSAIKTNQEHVSATETAYSSDSASVPGSEDCCIPDSSQNGSELSFSEARLPSPYAAHDYCRWSSEYWALLYKTRQDLYYYHYQLHVHALGWGSEEWDEFRSTYPDQMATLEAYNSNWDVHGTPDHPLPGTGEPLIEGGYATEEWLSSMNAASGSPATESQRSCGEEGCASESAACTNEVAGASDAVATEEIRDAAVPSDHANASPGPEAAASSSLPNGQATGTSVCPAEGFCSGKADPIGPSTTKLQDTRQIFSLNARESSSCSSCDECEDRDEVDCAEVVTHAHQAAPSPCIDAIEATAWAANAAEPDNGEVPVSRVNDFPDLICFGDEPAIEADDPFLATDGCAGVIQRPAPQMVPCQALSGRPLASLQSVQTQTDTSVDCLKKVTEELQQAAAREKSLLQALQEAQTEKAALRAALEDCNCSLAEIESRSCEVSGRLSVTEADLGATKQQLAEAAEREAALESRAQARDLELAAFRSCSVDLREDNARLRAEVAALKQEQLQGQSTPPQVQESAEASVSCTAVVQPSQPAGTNAPGATAARQGAEAEAEAVEGMPFSVGVKMAQLCIAGDPLFSEGLLTSPALKVSSRHADLLQRWTSPRPAAGQPAAGRRVDHAAGSSSVSPCRRTCSDGAGHVAPADASADVPATPELAGHPSLTLKVKGEQGRGPRGFDGEVGCGWRERASATGSPSHSHSLSPAKRPHTPHQSKLSTDTVSGSHC